MTNLDSILKSRDITLLTKIWIVKAMVFPVVLYRCESQTIKEAFLSACFHQLERIDNFKLWCWGRFESPLDSKEIKPVNPKGNQPWIFIGRTDAKDRLIEKDPWTVNFQMFKLVLAKAEEPGIKLPTSAGSWQRKQLQPTSVLLSGNPMDGGAW